MRVFAMGDIHGAHKLLNQCLERSGFDREHDMLIQLGDVADGFGEVYECVEELLKIRNLVSIKGNHDDWFLEFIRTGAHPRDWMHGGIMTARSYLKLSGREKSIEKSGEHFKTALNNTDIPKTHQDFFERQQPYYIDGENNCFVHAGFNRLLKMQEQGPEIFYWDRELWTSALDHHFQKMRGYDQEPFRFATNFHEIFIGHTPTTIWGTDKPMRAINILNLDTGAGHSGRLTVMDIHTKQYWQSERVSELYPEYDRKVTGLPTYNGN